MGLPLLQGLTQSIKQSMLKAIIKSSNMPDLHDVEKIKLR